MTTSVNSTEPNDINSSVSGSRNPKMGIPAIPKRPTIIRVDKQNVEENVNEPKCRGVPKVPPRPPPPKRAPPPVPSKQPVAHKLSEEDKKKKKPEITVVSSRPMSEICFRDKKPEVPVPPRPQKLKDQGEVSSTPNINCALSTEPSKQTRPSKKNARCKSFTLPPRRPHLPPATVAKKDPSRVPPQRPAPLKLTLPKSVEPSFPSKPPSCIQLENVQPQTDQKDSSFKSLKEQSQSTDGLVIPPKPRPRTYFDASLKPHKPAIVRRSVSAYKPTKDGVPPQPLPRKYATSSTTGSDASKSLTLEEPVVEVTPPPKPSRHQSFRNPNTPIYPFTFPYYSSPPLQSQDASLESTPTIQPLSSLSTTETKTSDTTPTGTEEATHADQTNTLSSETPESFNIENESSSTGKTVPCLLPPKNSVVISPQVTKCSSEEDIPVPLPRVKHLSRPDTPASTPIDSVPNVTDTPASTPVSLDPVPTVSEEPKHFILPSAKEILTPATNKPTIIRASQSIESPQELKPIPDITKKEPNLSESSGNLLLKDTTPNRHLKDPEPPPKTQKVPPPVPKKNPISAKICDRNVSNGISTKTVPQPPVPKKPPKPCPPPVAQMPVKNKQNQPKDLEAKADDGSSGGSSSSNNGSSNLIKNLIFSKRSGSPSSSSTDLKKPSAVKSRKAADMLQTTKDYTRRITQSLGFTPAEEPTTIWYTDKTEEPEEKVCSLNKKKENPSIWYIDADPEEETTKVSVTSKPALQIDKTTKEMGNALTQLTEEAVPTEEPSPTEISAFQKYHSYMKRTIEEAVGIQLKQSSSSLLDESLSEEQGEQGSAVMKPQPVKPAVLDPPKQRPPIPPKAESQPPKLSAPQVKPNVPAVPPKRPTVSASITQSTKSDGPATRPPPPRPKPMVSVKRTIPDKQNATSDSEYTLKNVNKLEERSPSIENLIGKFEEELCKKSVPPPRPAPPVSKSKTVTSNLTDNQELKMSTENKEKVQSVDAELTSMPSNMSTDHSLQPDENENVSVTAAEAGENIGETLKNEVSNLTTENLIDENANEGEDNVPGKLQEANTVSAVDAELETVGTSVIETKPGLGHRVVYSDSFNQRCKSLMDDLKIHFENVEKDVVDEKIKETVGPGSESFDQLDANPEKMQDSSSNEETEEKELDEKFNLPSSEEKELDDRPDLPSLKEKELNKKPDFPVSEEKELDKKPDLPISEDKELDKKLDLSISEEKELDKKLDLPISEEKELDKKLDLPVSEEKELDEKPDLSISEEKHLDGKPDLPFSVEKELDKKPDLLISEEKELDEKTDLPISEEKELDKKPDLPISEEKELGEKPDLPSSKEKELDEKPDLPSSEEKSSSDPFLEVLKKTSQDDSISQIESRKVESDKKKVTENQDEATPVELVSEDKAPAEDIQSSTTSELTGPRAIVNFDFDAQEKDELMLKKDDIVKLLSWVDPSWLYGSCRCKTGIFPLTFIRIIEPLPQTPSDANGNIKITDVSQEQKQGNDATKISNVDCQRISTQVMDEAYQSLSEVRSGSATESKGEKEVPGILVVVEGSESAANRKDIVEEDELTDSDQLDKINIPVGGEEAIAYALYNFEGEDGELTFKEGDEINILKWVNEDWLLGKLDGVEGNLPANYVHFMGDSTDELELDIEDGPPEPKEPPPPLQPDVLEHVKRLKGFACARFDFEARDDDELSFKDGDRIEILEFVNDDWIRGSLHKKEGIFPVAFVSVEEYSPDEIHSSETTKVQALHDFTASANDELSFKAGVLITCHGDVPNLPGWSKGSFEDRTGIFPTEFVTHEGI